MYPTSNVTILLHCVFSHSFVDWQFVLSKVVVGLKELYIQISQAILKPKTQNETKISFFKDGKYIALFLETPSASIKSYFGSRDLVTFVEREQQTKSNYCTVYSECGFCQHKLCGKLKIHCPWYILATTLVEGLSTGGGVWREGKLRGKAWKKNTWKESWCGESVYHAESKQ